MSVVQTKIEKIRGYAATEELVALLRQIEAGTTDQGGWPSGSALEYLILRSFELQGAKVLHWPYDVKSPFSGQTAKNDSPLEQIDGMVLAGGLYCLVEAKDWSVPVHFEPIAKMRNQLLRRPAGTVGLIFSKSGFTDAAQQLSCFLFPQTVLLWELEEVEHCLEARTLRNGEKLDLIRGLQIKYERAVKDGDPKYNLGTEVKP